MIKKKLTVTIGIPIYNEDQNILYLLKSILQQQQTNYSIKKIVVISDASTDSTDGIIKGIKNRQLLFLRNKRRKGQSFCQNKIFALANTDVVVLFEGDSYPRDNYYLSILLAPLVNDKQTGLIQGYPKPLTPQKYLEKIFYAQDLAYTKFTVNRDRSEEFFVSGGGGRAFTKKVYKRLVWPQAVPEDSYAYMWCKLHKIKIIFQPSAACVYRLPQTLQDYWKKRQKVLSGEKALIRYFPSSCVNERYTIPLGLIIKMGMYLMLFHTLSFIGYLTIRLFEKLRSENNQFTDFWNIASSTKKLFD